MSQSQKTALEHLLHDVKTPLATIRALAQLTASQLRARGDEALAALLDKVDAQVDRIRALVQSVVEERRSAAAPESAVGTPREESEGLNR